MLQVKNLTKIYKTKSGVETTAVNNLTADFGDRGLTFILGKSGCGKSTLLNLLGGLDSPTSGEIIVDGKSRSDFTEKENADYRNTYVGFVFQEYNLVEEFSVGENIALALELQGEKDRKERVENALRAVGLVDAAGNTLYNRRTNELSGGQKQRVAIARALIKEPKIILADEPTGALDSETGKDIYKLLKELSKEKLVIVVTHDIAAAPEYGDRTIELSDGKIKSDSGMPAENEKNENAGAGETKRGKLSFLHTFLLGATALKHKPMRLMFSILLSALAFVMFAVSFTASAMNVYKIDLETLKNKNLSYYLIDTTDSKQQHPIIDEYTGGKTIYVNCYTYFVQGSLSVEALSDGFGWLCLNSEYEVKMTAGITETDLGLQPDSRFINKSLCRLPQNENEVAITDIIAQAYMYWGFLDEEEVTHQISTPDDLIGLNVKGRKIVGVYQTETSREEALKYYGEKSNSGAEKDDEYKGLRNSPGLFSFIFDNSDSRAGHVLMKYDGNINETLEMFDKLNAADDEKESDVVLLSANHHLMAPIRVIITYAVPIMQIAAIVLTVFSILLTINFLLVNLDSRKKQIGILRAMGARRGDIVGICLAESGCIAAIEFVLSLILTAIVCAIINGAVSLVVMSMSFVGILLLLLMVFGTTLVATILPACLTVHKKPVDILNER